MLNGNNSNQVREALDKDVIVSSTVVRRKLPNSLPQTSPEASFNNSGKASSAHSGQEYSYPNYKNNDQTSPTVAEKQDSTIRGKQTDPKTLEPILQTFLILERNIHPFWVSMWQKNLNQLRLKTRIPELLYPPR